MATTVTPGSWCAKCGKPMPPGAGDTCPRCLLRLGLESPEPLMPERLGAYEIVSRLGAGGMGEVYRARDTRLHREVAIKVLPDLVAGDPERIARFRREARVAASLHHPHIAGIYGFEDEGGAHFLVMELVEGVTLAERLRSGAMPIDEAVAIAEQIAEGLEAAHESGIVHRDLKPANVKITPAGKAKILDFGLAKAVDDQGMGALSVSGAHGTASGGAAGSGDVAHTSVGMVFGTAPYMSPEQARGRSVDKRSDIWSLGCVLYECLAGRRAFEGNTATEVLAKILERDPDWEALPARTPPRVRELLERCLEKDPSRRMRDSGDVRNELERALAAREWTTSGSIRAAAEAPPPTRASRTSILPWTIAALALGGSLVWMVSVGGGLPGGAGRRNGAAPRPSSAPMHMLMNDPDVPRVPYQDAPTIAISPDGSTVAYTGRGPDDFGNRLGLYLRRADGIRARRLDNPCDVRMERQNVSDPFFSPDGKFIGFSCGNLYTLSLAGGPATTLHESIIPLKGATWSPDGIIFSPGAKAGLVLVKEGGGPLETLTVPDASKGEVSHRWPWALPDGRHVLFTIKKEGIQSFDQGEIALLDLRTRKYTTLVTGGTYARYLSAGQMVFARGSTLLGVALDLDDGRILGTPIPVAEGVMTEPGNGAAQYAVARDAGTLVFVPGGSNVARNELAWVDRKGTITPIGAPLQAFHTTLVSPDGTRLASTVFGATDGVYVYELATRSLSRITSEGNCSLLGWSRDGRQILYAGDKDGVQFFVRNADGSGTARRIDIEPAKIEAGALAGTGNELSMVTIENGSLWLTPLTGDKRPPQRVGDDLPMSPNSLTVSPDGRWIAYCSDESGRFEVYVRSLSTGRGTWQISRGGGVAPSWTGRSDEVAFARESGNTRWECSVRLTATGGQIAASAPVDLFPVPADSDVWSIHPDGTRFALVRHLPPAFKGDRVEAILGWSEEVAARISGK